MLSEWEGLSKGKLSGLAFEAKWEEALAELETVGLARGERELTQLPHQDRSEFGCRRATGHETVA